ncbi:MAG TPA: helix-hairpin-helix domain-containing protein [Pseudomonadales bacterium]|jgi:competence protein ComEA|nr:helix-hairpin-helix domain-containing protein [Pseudomonadales bacterium]MDP7313838.1 helix-hairpin-helix domain-containing protein [Pseudomonadales bacterium]HJP51720.1 helix-hairpin-helix domain-containing protein [Pseudomonadales bacterium]|tara:strand:- start:1535 stop:1843 length:309 start_codon:yes stop_codon:yes gene_type:complete
MKARNLFVTFFTFLLLCWGNVVMADDIASDGNEGELEVTVNINTADAETLASVLDGVGLSRAHAIVTYREDHGLFYSAEELSAVRGIGITTVQKNVSKIVTE